MKNVILLCILLISFSSCQKSNDLVSTDNSAVSGNNIPVSQVPVVVVAAWNAKYPTAGGEIEWQKEDGNTYKVKFWLAAERWQAIFTATGGFVSEKKLN